MKTPLSRRLLALGLAGLCVCAVAACSNSKKEDEAYKNAKALPPLEVPPDLINPPKDAGTAIPEPPRGKAAPSSEAPPSNPAVAAVNAASVTPGIHIVKEGARRWLVVPAATERVRQRVKDFLEQKGFTIAKEDPAAGLVETDWRGGGEEIGGDNDLNAALKSGLRDKYKLLVEPGAVAGTSEVTVSHLGLQRQTAVDGKPVWQPRVSDPILEAELLEGLRAFLTSDESAAEPANALPAVKAQLRTDNQGLATLTIGEDFERAWWLVGMSLDHGGFVVDDRNRSEGVYLIRLGTAFKDNSGFVSRLFGSKAGDADQQYRVVLKENGGETAVVVQYSGGGPVTVSTGARILEKIKDTLGDDSTFRDTGKRQSRERDAGRGRSHPDTD
jgi:outer membrane protein assembly factor BamC